MARRAEDNHGRKNHRRSLKDLRGQSGLDRNMRPKYRDTIRMCRGLFARNDVKRLKVKYVTCGGIEGRVNQDERAANYEMN